MTTIRAALAAVMLLMPLLAGCASASPPASGGQEPRIVAGWERLPDGPLSGRTGAIVAPLGPERVLVVGGWAFLCPPGADCDGPEEPPYRDGAILDLASGDWEPISDAPYDIQNAPTAVVGTEVHVLTPCALDRDCWGRYTLLTYDSRTDRWEERATLPGKRYISDLVPVGDGLLAVSDSDEYGERDDRLYDPGADFWRPIPDDPLPSAYDRHVVVDGDRLLLFGSTLDQAGERDVKIGAALDLATMSWSRLPDAPWSGYQVWRVDEEAWLDPPYGGGGGVLDLRTDTWREFPAGPDAEDWKETPDLAGLIGEKGAIYEYDAGWVRDTRINAWVRIPDRPGAAYDESLAAVGDDLVVFGGQDFSRNDGGELLAETWLWRPPG